jgi:uncharacterized protein (DUF4415 family)
MNDEQPKVKKGRGPGKKPRLFSTSLRMDRSVLEFYKTHYPDNMQAKMREVLTDYANNQLVQLLAKQGAQNGTQEND